MRTLLPVFAAALVLIAVPAAAEVFSGNNGIYFSLTHGQPTSVGSADLKITTSGIVATNGIKRSSRTGDFQTNEVTVLGEPYDLKDATGGKWRLWIRSAEGEAVKIELIRARSIAHADRIFQEAGVMIDGAAVEPNFEQLVLHANGTYTLGASQGRYRADEGGIILDKAQGLGRGVYTVNGDGITFRFQRGLLNMEVKYAERMNVAAR